MPETLDNTAESHDDVQSSAELANELAAMTAKTPAVEFEHIDTQADIGYVPHTPAELRRIEKERADRSIRQAMAEAREALNRTRPLEAPEISAPPVITQAQLDKMPKRP